MNLHSPSGSGGRAMGVDAEVICWTRMQSEAGQTLDQIIARKELERRANEGIFFWGVGNAPATAIRAMARSRLRIPAIFSVMKSRPKAVDANPARIFAWRGYLDAYGVERRLPDHSIVLSRADSPKGVKKVHYALICHSPEQLKRQGSEIFDPGQYRNFGGNEAPVGASQVTALLKKTEEGVESDSAAYRVDLKASLVDGYWVKLTKPALVPLALHQSVAGAGDLMINDWVELASQIAKLAAHDEPREFQLI